jgi:hypothetical protein
MTKARVAQLVEHDLAKVVVASSNLVSRSKKPLKKGFVISGHLEFQMGLRALLNSRVSRDGGIGRHARLKILWEQSRAGSIPAPGTYQKSLAAMRGFFLCLIRFGSNDYISFQILLLQNSI